jgi:iron complex transport system substrate-binding protein
VVEDLEPEEKKTVYYESDTKYTVYGGLSPLNGMISAAGGVNIYDDILLEDFDADPEDLAERDPDVIFKLTTLGEKGYSVNSTSEFEEIRKEIMTRPELSWVTAVNNGDIYIVNWGLTAGFRRIIGPVFLAKCLYPEKFEDLEPHDYLKEYMEEWLRIPYQGVYIYPYPPK